MGHLPLLIVPIILSNTLTQRPTFPRGIQCLPGSTLRHFRYAYREILLCTFWKSHPPTENLQIQEIQIVRCFSKPCNTQYTTEYRKVKKNIRNIRDHEKLRNFCICLLQKLLFEYYGVLHCKFHCLKMIYHCKYSEAKTGKEIVSCPSAQCLACETRCVVTFLYLQRPKFKQQF